MKGEDFEIFRKDLIEHTLDYVNTTSYLGKIEDPLHVEILKDMCCWANSFIDSIPESLSEKYEVIRRVTYIISNIMFSLMEDEGKGADLSGFDINDFDDDNYRDIVKDLRDFLKKHPEVWNLY